MLHLLLLPNGLVIPLYYCSATEISDKLAPNKCAAIKEENTNAGEVLVILPLLAPKNIKLRQRLLKLYE